MFAWLGTQPADDFHSAIFLRAINKRLPPQIVIEVHFVPTLSEPAHAGLDGLNPHGLGIFAQEGIGAVWIIVEKEDAVCRSEAGTDVGALVKAHDGRFGARERFSRFVRLTHRLRYHGNHPSGGSVRPACVEKSEVLQSQVRDLVIAVAVRDDFGKRVIGDR
jgi:hypothetical protein